MYRSDIHLSMIVLHILNIRQTFFSFLLLTFVKLNCLKIKSLCLNNVGEIIILCLKSAVIKLQLLGSEETMSHPKNTVLAYSVKERMPIAILHLIT